MNRTFSIAAAFQLTTCFAIAAFACQLTDIHQAAAEFVFTTAVICALRTVATSLGFSGSRKVLVVLLAATAAWLAYEWLSHDWPQYDWRRLDWIQKTQYFLDSIFGNIRGPFVYLGYYFMIEFFRILYAMGHIPDANQKVPESNETS